MGLLDAYQQPQGAMATGQPTAQASNSGALQMAQQLLQNPTAQTAQQIVQQMKQTGMEGADQFAELFQKIGDDPEGLRHIAQEVISNLQSQ